MDANDQYHQALIDLSGNKRLIFLAGRVRAQLARAHVVTMPMRVKLNETNDALRLTYDALLAGDWLRAKGIYNEHASELLKVLLMIITQYKLTSL